MTNKDRQLFEACCKVALIMELRNNKLIYESKNYKDLENEIKSLSYKNVLNLIFKEASIPELEPEDKRDLKYSAAIAAGSVAGGAFLNGKLGVNNLKGAVIAAVALFLFRKAMNPCVRQSVKMKGGVRERRINFHECQAKAAREVLSNLVPKLSTCAASKNPHRCHRNLTNVINHWKDVYERETLKIAQLERASS